MKETRKRATLVIVCIIFQTARASVNGKPDEGLIKQLLQKSYHQCMKECDHANNCLSAKHIRLSSLCTLYDVVYAGSLGPGVTVYIKPGVENTITTEQCYSENECKDTCGEPTPILGTEMLGNMVSLGAKIMYRCFDRSESAISKCLSNGSWSMQNLNCQCVEPGSLPTDNAWTYKIIENLKNETEVIFCAGAGSAACNVGTGLWSNLSTYCNPCGPDKHDLEYCRRFNGSRLFFGKENITWEAAFNNCQAINGNLVEIGSEEKNNFIFNLTEGKVWIGATNSTRSDGWSWSATDTKLEHGYTNWAPHEPSGDGDCAHINVNNEWNDAQCSVTMRYVCDIF